MWFDGLWSLHFGDVSKKVISNLRCYLKLGKTLPTFSTSQRLKIALGGFVSFTGFTILVAVILTATGAADMQSVFQNEVMVGGVAFMGFLDVLCGLLLVFREKRIKWLSTSQKKKPDDYVNQPNKTPDSKSE